MATFVATLPRYHTFLFSFLAQWFSFKEGVVGEKNLLLTLKVVFDSFPIKLHSLLEMVQSKVLFSKNCFADLFHCPRLSWWHKLSYCFRFYFVQVFADRGRQVWWRYYAQDSATAVRPKTANRLHEKYFQQVYKTTKQNKYIWHDISRKRKIFLVIYISDHEIVRMKNWLKLGQFSFSKFDFPLIKSIKFSVGGSTSPNWNWWSSLRNSPTNAE